MRILILRIELFVTEVITHKAPLYFKYRIPKNSNIFYVINFSFCSFVWLFCASSNNCLGCLNMYSVFLNVSHVF